MTQRLTRKQAAILGAYTAHTLGPYSDVIKYVRTLKSFETVDEKALTGYKSQIKAASKADALAICAQPEDSLEEPVKPSASFDRLLSLLEELNKRFPHAVGIAAPKGELIEVEYLKAIDRVISLGNMVNLGDPLPSIVEDIEPVQFVERFVGAASQEELFLQAVNSLRPPDEKKGVHYATLRKTLDS